MNTRRKEGRRRRRRYRGRSSRWCSHANKHESIPRSSAQEICSVPQGEKKNVVKEDTPIASTDHCHTPSLKNESLSFLPMTPFSHKKRGAGRVDEPGFRSCLSQAAKERWQTVSGSCPNSEAPRCGSS